MSSNPTHEHHEAFLRGLRQVFGLYQAPEPAAASLVACAMGVQDSTTLLSGIYGSGKTQLVHLVRRTFFSADGGDGFDFGFVACTQDLTPMDTLFSLDLARLIRGHEVVRPREVVTSRLKFVNEAQRASSLVYNALLPLLAERLVAYRDQVFTSPPFICILDANPHDAGSSEMPTAFLDRVDYSYDLPTASCGGLVRVLDTLVGDGVRWGWLADRAEPVMTAADMERLWVDVRRVEVGREVRGLGALVAAYVQRCVHLDRSTAGPDHDPPCSTCSFRGDVCSKLAAVPGSRFLLSALRLAQARAWLRGDGAAAVDDLLYALPFTLAHRLKVRADSLRLYPSLRQWLLEEFYRRGVRPKVPRWRQVLRVLEAGEGERLPLVLDLARRDLAVADLVGDRTVAAALAVGRSSPGAGELSA